MKYNIKDNVGKKITIFTYCKDLNSLGTLLGEPYGRYTKNGIIACKNGHFYLDGLGNGNGGITEDTSMEESFGVFSKYIIEGYEN